MIRTIATCTPGATSCTASIASFLYGSKDGEVDGNLTRLHLCIGLMSKAISPAQVDLNYDQRITDDVPDGDAGGRQDYLFLELTENA